MKHDGDRLHETPVSELIQKDNTAFPCASVQHQNIRSNAILTACFDAVSRLADQWPHKLWQRETGSEKQGKTKKVHERIWHTQHHIKDNPHTSDGHRVLQHVASPSKIELCWYKASPRWQCNKTISSISALSISYTDLSWRQSGSSNDTTCSRPLHKHIHWY